MQGHTSSVHEKRREGGTHTQHGQTNKQEHALILVVSPTGQLDSYPPPDTALYSYSYSYKYQEK